MVINMVGCQNELCVMWPCALMADSDANYYVVSQSNCSQLPEGVAKSIFTSLTFKLHGWGSWFVSVYLLGVTVYSQKVSYKSS